MFRTLHRYLLIQTLATLGLTVLTFTFILLLGNILKDVLDLMASGQASVGLVVEAILRLIPFALAFALPIGMLTAALLVFGRLSADNELTAIRASGLSLAWSVIPVISLSVVLSGVCLWFNGDLAPRCRVAFKELQYRAVRERGQQWLTGGRYLEFGTLTLFAREINGSEMRDVLAYQVVDGRRQLDVWAPEAQLGPATNGLPGSITLKNMQGLMWTGSEYQPVYAQSWPTNLAGFRAQESSRVKITDMTFGQLRQELRHRRSEGGPVTPILVQMHRQVSFSLACIGFTLVGIPLGVRAHRRETNIGIAIALGLLLVYYSFIIIGQALQTRPDLHPQWILWLPNGLFVGIGSWLLWRANRGI
ncbi:MAG: LptF/LptG family permease [Verrucomicrobiota bacterium]